MLSDNKSVLDYMQTLKQLLGYFNMYHTDSNVETVKVDRVNCVISFTDILSSFILSNVKSVPMWRLFLDTGNYDIYIYFLSNLI